MPTQTRSEKALQAWREKGEEFVGFLSAIHRELKGIADEFQRLPPEAQRATIKAMSSEEENHGDSPRP